MPAPKDNRTATLKDVARVAGVHFTTVSLALRDHPSIPEVTRTRIRGVAQQLGYARNPVFSALAQFHVHGRKRGAAPQLGFVINRDRKRRCDFFRSPDLFLGGAREQARVLGYTLEILQLGPSHYTSPGLETQLRKRGISGIVLGGFEPGQDALSLPWDDYAVVKINSMHVLPVVMTVSNDHRQEVRLAFRQLRAKGYRRIGLALSRADELSTQHRYSGGYLVEQQALPADQQVSPLVFPLGATRDDAIALLRPWVQQQQVDAVLSPCPRIEHLLMAAGFAVPGQVACACLCIATAHGNQHLAGIRPNHRTVGAKAVSQLATQLKVGERGVPDFSPQTYVPSEWQDGNSAPGQS